jgi:uncharacterized membrane protein
MADAPAGGIYVVATSKGDMTVCWAAATEQAASLVVVTLTTIVSGHGVVLGATVLTWLPG